MLLKYTNAMGLSSSVLSPISDFVHNIYTCDLSVHPATRTFCCVHKTTWSNIGSCNFTYEIMRLVFTCCITFFFFLVSGKNNKTEQEKFHSWMTTSSKTKSLDVLTMWREPGPPPWIPQEWSVERRPPCSQSGLYQQPPVGTQKHT